MRRAASGIAGSIARRARDLVSSDLLGVGTSPGFAIDARHSRSSPDVAPKHHRNHPRVAVPSALTVEQLRSAPFESNALEPCGDDDAATMSRQIRKRRAYPVACAARCRHGFARAYLHAPLHVPAATASGFDGFPGDESAPGPSPGTPNPVEPEPLKATSSRRGRSRGSRSKAKAALASPSGGAQAEHALGWLACPLLDREVDKLERRGGIDAMASVISLTPSLSAALERAHRSAVSVRRWMLPSQWTERVERHDGFEQIRHVLFRTGLVGVSLDKEEGFVGGWRGNRVKCLHAQLGDALVRGERANPVGGLVMRRLVELGVETTGSAECWRECAASDDPRRDAR